MYDPSVFERIVFELGSELLNMYSLLHLTSLKQVDQKVISVRVLLPLVFCALLSKGHFYQHKTSIHKSD